MGFIGADIEVGVEIGASTEPERLPLSDAQRAVWLDLQRLDDRRVYQVGALITIRADVDVALARQAVRLVMGRHDALRLRVDRNEPVQWLVRDGEVPFSHLDLGTRPDPDQALTDHLAQMQAAGFDLGEEPLFKIHLIRLGPSDWRIIMICHHLICDGISSALLQRHWLQAYMILSGDSLSEDADEERAETDTLSLARSSYLPFIRDDAAYRVSARAAEDLDYWRNRLSPLPSLLFEDRPRPDGSVADVKPSLLTLDREAFAKFSAAADGVGATPHRAFVALLAVALGRRYGKADFAIGMALHGRTAGNRHVIGMLAGLMPVRCRLDPGATLRTNVERLATVVDVDLRHARLPVDELGRSLGLGAAGRQSLFDVVVTIMPPMGDDDGSGLTSEPLRTVEITPLALYVRELGAGRGMTIEFAYSGALLCGAEVVRLRAVFADVIEAFGTRPNVRLSLLDGLSRDERQRIDGLSQGERLDVPESTLADLVRRKTMASPDAPAVVSDETTLTYRQLDQAAARVAERLVECGFAAGAVVGVAIPRSAMSVVALLGVLKAGCVYLPLDPAYPEARLAGMIEDSGARIILTRDASAQGSFAGAPALALDDSWVFATPAFPVAMPEITPASLAYIVYTSGSTGRPKGVAVSHAAAVNLAYARRIHDPIGPGDRILAAISIGFDVSIGQLLLPLLSGAAIVVAGDVRGQSPQAFWELMVRHAISHVNSVPSFFEAMLPGVPDGHTLKQVMLGGEPLSGSLAARLTRRLGGVRIVNMYGPTETCIDASAFIVPTAGTEAWAVLPIGRPLPNYTFHILDEHHETVGIGAAGELYIGGAGLAVGYVGQPDLTAERFVSHPLHGRLYRTGDRAAWREDGQVAFLGRLDDQVKIRGHRVELGEIEAVLLAHPAVAQAAVLARPSPRGDQSLVAYVVSQPGQRPETAEIDAHLARVLPAHMRPAFYRLIDAIPLTPNGKIDHKALPQPDESGRVAGTPPRTPTELWLAEHFSALLGAREVVREDSFFALGGHSLLATQLAARVRSELRIELPIRLLFEAPRLGDLAARIDALRAIDAEVLPPIVTGPRPALLPLSYPQERIWFVDRLQQDASYNIPIALKLEGALDAEAVERSIEAIVRRHEALRTRLRFEDGRPVQTVEVIERLELPRIEASEAELPDLLRLLAAHRFDLEAGWPFAFRLIAIAPERHVLAMVIHHTAFDGWSAGVFHREFVDLYRAFAERRPSTLPPPTIQYPDFALWQRRQNQDAAIDFWTDALRDAPALSTLPGREGATSRAAATRRFAIDAHVHARLQKLAEARGASLFMVLHAAFATVLSRASGQADVVIGTAVANRTRAEFEGAIGCFVNTLPLRTRMEPQDTFLDLLERVKAGDLDAFAHQDLPFEHLVQALQPPRSRDHSPMFQVMFVLQNAPVPAADLPGFSVTPIPIEAETAKFDVTLVIADREGTIEFAKDRFDTADIERLAWQFETVLAAVADHPAQPLAAIDLLPFHERLLVTETWNRTEAAFPRGTLDGLFAEQVRRTPEGLAVIAAGRAWTYAELDEASTRLARWLASRGVGPETVVGVKMVRSAETIVAFLAILKAGGAYLPLDPAYPSDRLAFMASDAGALLVLESIEGLDADVALRVSADPERLAYVIYTSGTTGLPKGVAVSHGAPVNLAFARNACHDPIGPGDRILAAISVGFDVSIGQLLLPLLSGATVVVAEDVRTMDAADVWAFLAEHRVTHVNSVPSFFDSLLQSPPVPDTLALKRVMLGGEALTGALTGRIRRLLPGVEVVNMYGPTEACIDALHHVASHADLSESVVPIGRPLSNYTAYILDSEMRPVPIGVPGELWLGGAGLARGYVNAPELTAARFVEAFGGRLYRTGDLAQWRSDGRIAFLGRVDQQVKIRGFRVEPGEIAAVLLDHADVAQAVVVPREAKLVAYVVPRDGAEVDGPALRAHLTRRLPDYMVPSAFVALAAVPLNANGKLDLKALPAPHYEEGAYLAPRTPTEEAVAGFFAEVLGIERCGALDDFFALGGHSLLATRLVSKIRDLGVALPLKAVFETPTVDALARAIDAAPKVLLDQIVVEPRPALLPLSFPQERIWFVDRLQQDAGYNIPIALELEGVLDAEAVARALEEIVRRHEALRTRIVVAEGKPVQIVDGFEGLALHRIEAREAELPGLLARLATHRFDLEAGWPFAFRLIAIAPERHVLAMVLHHAAFDGWSAGVFHREFVGLYQAFSQRRPSPLPPLRLQYADFALWQRRQDRDVDLQYWLDELKDAPPRSELPGRDLPPGEFARIPGSVPIRFDERLSSALLRLARDHNASLFMVLHAAFALMLRRWNGQDDIVIGTVVANRRRAEFETMLGCFVNTVPLRTRFRSGESFGALLARVAEGDLAAFAHQDLPFEQLFAALGLDRSMRHAPVFQAMFILQNTPPVAMGWPGLTVKPLGVALDVAKFDLMLMLEDRKDGLRGAIEFAANRFDPAMVARFADQFHRLLAAVAADPGRDPATIDLLSEEDRSKILQVWNHPAVDFPSGTLDAIFSAQARATPEALAVVDRDGREITYGELDEASTRLARSLVAEGVGPERVVGVRMERSAAIIVAMLGILKAGGVYLPLDPTYPQARLDYMAADAGAMLVLDAVEGLSGEADLPPSGDPAGLAYIIYTSGTTGRPKGVAVAHQAAVNLLHARSASYDPLHPGDRVLAVTSVGFDMSIEQMLFPLLRGATVVVADDVRSLGSDGFWDLVSRRTVTHIDFVPSFLESIFSSARTAGPLALKRLMLGGEAVSGAFLAKILHDMPGLEVVNVYGPTETCIDATFHVATAADIAAGVLPIGRPLPNYTAYILDAHRQVVAPGVAGELYIGGRGLARGYINAPGLTAERFVESFTGRLYRTGDRARWRDDGCIEFLGRQDEQIKIRGFRVELGEIAAALMEHPDVAKAVVVPRIFAGQTRLVAFVVGTGRPADLEAHLAQRLPDHMVPSAIVPIDEVPLNGNGKLDASALPADLDHAVERVYVPPRGPREAELQPIWETILGVSPVGRDENFFELGGQSLTAIRLIHQIHMQCGVRLPMRALFERPTIAGLAAALRTGSDDARSHDLVPLQTRGAKPSLFCIHPGGGHVFCYVPLSRALGAERPVYGIQARGLDDTAPLPSSIEEMAAGYVELIVDAQPDGPLHLLGMSLGGLIAFEVARQLRSLGREVAFLAMMDTTIPEDITVVLTDELILPTLAAEFGLGDLVEPAMTLPQLIEKAMMAQRLPPGFTAERAERIAKVFCNMVELQMKYRPRPIDVPMLSIRARQRADANDRLPDWSRYSVRDVSTVDLDCAHNALISERLAPAVAVAVMRYLDRRVEPTIVAPAARRAASGQGIAAPAA